MLKKLEISEYFSHLELSDKFKIILSQASNIKLTAKFIIDIYNKRSKMINK